MSDKDFLATFVGDVAISLGDLVKRSDAGANPRVPQRLAEAISGCDFLLFNAEGSVNGQHFKALTKTGPPTLIPEEFLAMVAQLRCDTTASLANNHMLDFGPGALMADVETFQSVGISTVGCITAKHDCSTVIKNINGYRLGFAAFAEQEFNVDHTGAAVLADYRQALEISENLKSCDHKIAVVHGGVEGEFLPPPSLVDFCKFLIDIGFSAVICGHSHCPGPAYVYRGRHICFSSGNFYFPKSQKNPNWWDISTCIDIRIRGRDVSLNQRFYRVDYERSEARDLSREELDQLKHIHLAVVESLSHPKAYRKAWNELCRRHQHKINSVFYVPFYLRGLTRLLRRLRITPRKIGKTAVLADFDMLHCASHLDILKENSRERISAIRELR